MMCVSLSVVCDRLITNGTWERRTPSGPVARGPVPRECPTCAKTARQPGPFPRPRPGEGQALALRAAAHFFRSAGALGCHTRIRAGFSRDRWSAPTMTRDRFSHRPTMKRAFCRPIASRPGGLAYWGNGSVRGITKPFKSCYSQLKVNLTEENCILLEKNLTNSISLC